MPTEFKFHMNLNIDKLTALTKQFVSEALLEMGSIVEEDAKRLCPVDRGTLRSSIRHKLEKWNILRVGTSQSTYAAAVEYGTPPHGPPVDPAKGIEESPIGEWAKRHGIPEAAWAIWWKIYHHGTPPRPYLRPAIFNNQRVFAQILANAMREAAKETKK